MSSSGQNRVLIIGGGLGGLALAQGLKRANTPVPCHIFERDSSADFRPQGYRIRINPDGACALQKLLPDHLWNAYEDTCAVFNPGMSGLDAVTGQKPAPSGERRGPPPMAEGKYYNADRVVLRTVLLEGLENDISFGKTFESYCVTGDGVEVTFTDGTKETGAILVGADGTRSHIRRQLMPNYTVLDTECGAIYGKTFIKPETGASLAKEFFGGICLAGDSNKPGLKLFTDTMEFPQDLSLDERAKFRVPDDYVYWVLCINRTLLGIAAEDLHSAQSVEVTKSWHPTVRSLLQNQDPSASSTLAFFASSPETFKREWDQLVESPDGAAVTLLGDAAHPMTPVGGVGANSAFQEAADLCSVITRGEGLKGYAKLLTERGEKTVGLSGGGAGHMFQMKPFSELKVASL
ncbi:salicylate 1-monooxygenase (flavo monooxygenase) [Fusarium pseudoanthophilum]|uniref:Salicylate 1-monooxygenase (Flavo monooxygenase) n=1 Tax=Fusarium pseudoanthophilum TaxID=48495 RepID=A0A8H5KY47_9HYPO|nr:salicylate 1-monooxygenase (flavo monooxygenase) [Fusarium pseudoanthophilum]